jgi:Domain of unknown function (DUF4384)/Sel1 repeat
MPHRPHRSLLPMIALLGLTLRAGLGAEPELAADRAAAAAGDPGALARLAERYETGAGVPFDLEVASALFELAAERGDAVAQYRLGLLQAGGLAPEADPAEAYQWFRLAAQSAADAPIGLLAGAMSEVLEERLDATAIERAGQRVAAFQPASGPAEIPLLASGVMPDGDPASLAAVLPPLGCGASETVTAGDRGLTLLAYAPSGSIADTAITPGIRADLARRGAALDVTLLSPAVCAIRAVTAAQPDAGAASAFSLVGVADGSRAVLRDGDMLVLDVPAASEPRYVSVDYVVHTGQVWHLHPLAGDDGYLPAGQSLRLGDGANGAAWQVGAPFGADLVLVSVSPAPFGVDRQPGEESVEAYRSRLQGRLQPASGDPVSVFQRVIETQAR